MAWPSLPSPTNRPLQYKATRQNSQESSNLHSIANTLLSFVCLPSTIVARASPRTQCVLRTNPCRLNSQPGLAAALACTIFLQLYNVFSHRSEQTLATTFSRIHPPNRPPSVSLVPIVVTPQSFICISSSETFLKSASLQQVFPSLDMR